MACVRFRWAGLLIVLALSACASSATQRDLEEPDLSTCCIDVERYPPAVVRAASVGAPVLGRMAARISVRPGYLREQSDARAYVVEQLEPLDILVVRSEGKLTHRLIPGAFAHVAVYLGDEGDYRALGLLDHPAVADHRAAIEAGQTIIESDYRGVHLSSPAHVLNTDAVVVLRPQIEDTDARRRLVLAFLCRVGVRFDFHFSASDDRWLYCAELANNVLPDLGVPSHTAYGRTIILPDEFIASTLEGRTNMRLITFVKGDRAGWVVGTPNDLASMIAAAW